jgi:hypothetical protein
MAVELGKEHQWLQRLVGDWTFEAEAEGPEGETIRDTGTEFVRSLDGVWTLAEGRGQGPEGTEVTSITTLGYDPARGRFVGTFISSMMTYLWVYDGALDAEGRVLSLDARGPGYPDHTQMMDYRDTIELRGDDERVHTSSARQPDGSWHPFMSITYRRTL